MVEIEHEAMDIEDLFLTGKDKKTEIIITINGRGEFKALVTPVSYGEIKKLDKMSEMEIANYVLTNHFFKPNGEPLSSSELDLLPAGILKAVSETIMKLSGLDISNEDIQVF